MIRYISTALALKAFSICAPTRRLYRSLGNAVGNRSRSSGEMPAYYYERVQRTLDLANKYDLFKSGARTLELGTGWMHWESLTTRLFFNIKADLYDVWDNRQFDALKGHLAQLLKRIDKLTGLSSEQISRAAACAESISNRTDFSDLYKLLDFRYILEPEGTLACVPDATYDIVMSAGVFEHLPRAGVPDYIRSTFRVLKPGGFAIHSINTADHLHLYDRSASPKNYLRYSPRTWSLFYENEVQYINRLQRCEWMKIFADAGFELLEEYGSKSDISGLKVAPQYAHMDRTSLETTSWYCVYQKK